LENILYRFDQIPSSDKGLCSSLRHRLFEYKEQHPKLSSQQIAKRFDMSSSTLSRIENLDIKKPSLDQVIKVLRGTGATDDLVSYLDEFFPDIAKVYRNFYQNSAAEEFVKIDAEKYFESKDTFQIMLLAYSGQGTSREEVREIFGLSGEKQLEKLLKEKVLNEKQGGGIGDFGVVVKMSNSTTRKLFSLVVEHCYSEDNFEKGNNYINFRTFVGDRKKTMPKIQVVLKKARKEINNIIKEEEFNGSDHIFVGLISDLIIRQ